METVVILPGITQMYYWSDIYAIAEDAPTFEIAS